MMSEYNEFFSDNPWKNIEKPMYPDGYRLFLNDERFWVSMNNEGQILFFIHDSYSGNLHPPESLAGVKLELVKYANDSRRLVCTLTSNDLEVQSKFSIVTKDIAYKCSGLTGNLLFNKVIELIQSWANFLKPQRTGLSEAEYIGFWGELYTLSELFLKQHTSTDSLSFWVGPEGKKQDFTLNKLAIEVKTTFSSEARKITISSLEQLDKITEHLYILHIVANPSDARNGYSLKDLYELCLSKISNDLPSELLFLQKVTDLYGKASEKQLNSNCTLISLACYEITDSFPCLRREDVPSSISNLKYDLIVTEIRNYESKIAIEEVIKNG
jgi:hypothetical protein